MNIFYLDHDPVLAAEATCDKHVVKMILESAQLLCTAHHMLDTGLVYSQKVKLYKATHINHPASKWTRSRTSHYNWLSNHALALCREYTYRYNKIHKSQSLIEYCLQNPPLIDMCGCMLAPPQCMPDEYKMEDVVAAYRRYYIECKRNTIQMKWTKREPPRWWQEYVNSETKSN